jgi:hypothetical protein
VKSTNALHRYRSVLRLALTADNLYVMESFREEDGLLRLKYSSFGFSLIFFASMPHSSPLSSSNIYSLKVHEDASASLSSVPRSPVYTTVTLSSYVSMHVSTSHFLTSYSSPYRVCGCLNTSVATSCGSYRLTTTKLKGPFHQ